MTRNEAIKELELIAKVTMWNDRREAVEMAIEALKQEPRTGEWITNKDGYSKCSECGFSFGCIVCPHEETDYCPNCGAKMDKE